MLPLTKWLWSFFPFFLSNSAFRAIPSFGIGRGRRDQRRGVLARNQAVCFLVSSIQQGGWDVGLLRGRRGLQRKGKLVTKVPPQAASCGLLLTCSTLQVYSSTEHLATPSNLSFSSDRSHSEDKEDRSDAAGLSPSQAPAESVVEGRNAGRMAR